MFHQFGSYKASHSSTSRENFHKRIEMVAKIKGTWSEDNNWGERKLPEMYWSIKESFNFEMTKKARKSKRLEQ
eukprot:5864283-Ditylum_brightwellii.AAC.1